jgi:cytochrome c553
MIRFSMWRPLAATCISVLGSALYACAAPTASSTSLESASTEGEALEIQFPEMFSTFDPEHEAKIPAIVSGVSKVKWSVSDPEMVDIETQADGSAMITVRKPGTVTIKAKAGSLVGEAPLTVTAAGAGEWEAGNQRYNNGVVLKRGGRPDGGSQGGASGGAPDPERQQASCTNCHGSGGGDESHDVQHTPMQTAGYTDAELVSIFTKGKKPAGVEQRIMSAERWSRIHQWSMDEFAVKGLVVYLRTLEPRSQGTVDFGGRGPKGKDKGKGGETGGSANDAGTQEP